MKRYLLLAVFSALLLPAVASAADGTGKSGGWAEYISNHCYRPADDQRTFHTGDPNATGHAVGQATDMLLFGQLASGLVGVAGFLALRRRSGAARS